MHKVFLGIGGNIGNKHNNFKKVLHIIEKELGEIKNKSSVYETPPWGFHTKDNFWNQVILVQTSLSPAEVLENIHKIENQFGRTRKSIGYSSRKMDIDILYYDDLYLETENLIIPHPKMQLRKFVLIPLNEIAPGLKHPLLRFTSFQMLENCKDASVILKLDDSNISE